MAVVDEEEFERWWADAALARRAAEVQADAGIFNWACFLAEQAAQLAVKALLHGVGAPGWGRRPLDLVVAAAEVGGESWGESHRAAAARLARHYIPTRYADASPSGPAHRHYTADDARDAAKDTDHLMEAVKKSWDDLR